MKKTIISSILIGLSSTMFIGCSMFKSEPCDAECQEAKMISARDDVEFSQEAFQEPSIGDTKSLTNQTQFLETNKSIRVSVVGQGVSPVNTSSPAQAYALAKRAAIADAYRLIAEKVKGVHVEGQDLIENMMIKRSTVRTAVNAIIKNANLVETSFKEGLCEVEMEIVLLHSQFAI